MFARKARLLCLIALVTGMPAGAAVTWHTERETRAGKWEISARVARFTGTSRTSARWLADRELYGFVKNEMDAFERAAEKETVNPGYPMGMWGYHATTVVSLDRPDLVSAYVETYEFRGGAHGMTTYWGVNVGLVDGKAKVLRLEDLFRKGEPARALAIEAVEERLRANPNATWFQPGEDPGMRGPDAALIADFVITPSAVTFLIEPYVAGPYAVGSFFVKVPFSAFGDRLDPNGPLKGLL